MLSVTLAFLIGFLSMSVNLPVMLVFSYTLTSFAVTLISVLIGVALIIVELILFTYFSFPSNIAVM